MYYNGRHKITRQPFFILKAHFNHGKKEKGKESSPQEPPSIIFPTLGPARTIEGKFPRFGVCYDNPRQLLQSLISLRRSLSVGAMDGSGFVAARSNDHALVLIGSGPGGSDVDSRREPLRIWNCPSVLLLRNRHSFLFFRPENGRGFPGVLFDRGGWRGDGTRVGRRSSGAGKNCSLWGEQAPIGMGRRQPRPENTAVFSRCYEPAGPTRPTVAADS